LGATFVDGGARRPGSTMAGLGELPSPPRKAAQPDKERQQSGACFGCDFGLGCFSAQRLAMTWRTERSRSRASQRPSRRPERHCEERSDEAIPTGSRGGDRDCPVRVRMDFAALLGNKRSWRVVSCCGCAGRQDDARHGVDDDTSHRIVSVSLSNIRGTR